MDQKLVKAKHTTGPWEYDEINNTIGSHFGYPIASIKIPTRKYGFAGPSKQKLAETLSNAHLIAAAPELLENLKRILHNYIDDSDRNDPDILEARAIIRKAEGNEP